MNENNTPDRQSAIWRTLPAIAALVLVAGAMVVGIWLNARNRSDVADPEQTSGNVAGVGAGGSPSDTGNWTDYPPPPWDYTSPPWDYTSPPWDYHIPHNPPETTRDCCGIWIHSGGHDEHCVYNPNRICIVCNNPNTSRPGSPLCSVECAALYDQMTTAPQMNCSGCGVLFEGWFYCSPECVALPTTND
jgi:hypothetical protein